MTKRSVSRGSFEGCGFCSVPSLIDERYKRGVLCALANFGIVRFNKMKRYTGKISCKTLSSTLKALEADGLVRRREYPQIPPKVEYSLTERGRTLIPVLDLMCAWAHENGPEKEADGSAAAEA